MSYSYLAEIKSNKTLVASKTSTDLKKVVSWANSKTIVGDMVMLSEGYMCADGHFDVHDLLTSWRRNY
jgi:hypothetical protein